MKSHRSSGDMSGNIQMALCKCSFEFLDSEEKTRSCNEEFSNPNFHALPSAFFSSPLRPLAKQVSHPPSARETSNVRCVSVNSGALASAT